MILTQSREPDFPERFFTRNPTTSILGNGKMPEFRKTYLEIGFSAKIYPLKAGRPFSAKNYPLKAGRPFSEPGEAYVTRKSLKTSEKANRRTRGTTIGEHLEVRLRLFTQP